MYFGILSAVFFETASILFAAVGQTPVTPTAHQPIQLSDLQNILATMNVPASAAQASAGECHMMKGQLAGSQQLTTVNRVLCLPLVDLASVLTPEMMAPILTNAAVQQRLLPFLPSGETLLQNTEEIQNTLNSPQFQQVTTITTRMHCCLKRCRQSVSLFLQAMGLFSSALASGQLGPLLSQFGLPAEAVDAANRGGDPHTPHTQIISLFPFTTAFHCMVTGLVSTAESNP